MFQLKILALQKYRSRSIGLLMKFLLSLGQANNHTVPSHSCCYFIVYDGVGSIAIDNFDFLSRY